MFNTWQRDAWARTIDTDTKGGQDRRDNLEWFGDNAKLNVRSFCTGKLSEGTVTCFLNHLYKEHFDNIGRPLSHDVVVMTHGADTCKASQAIMLAHQSPAARDKDIPTCRRVFGDFTKERVTEAAVTLIRDVLRRWSQEESKDEK